MRKEYNLSTGEVSEHEDVLVIVESETAEQAKERIKVELAALEREALMPRGAREAFIALCEQQGQVAGLTKEQLYVANPFYKGLIDTDNKAKALRAQL